ncbi:MAG: hypothetical protein ACFHWZ_08095 [Phycisphaerales bacterium]
MSALRTTLLSKPVTSAKPAKKVVARRYHMHSGGVFYIVVTVLLGIGSINSQNNLLFIVFGVALGAMLVSGVVSGAMMMGLEVDRRPVAPRRSETTHASPIACGTRDGESRPWPSTSSRRIDPGENSASATANARSPKRSWMSFPPVRRRTSPRSCRASAAG